MNKLFSKIGVAIVGMAMAIGVGVAAVVNNNNLRAYAATDTSTINLASINSPTSQFAIDDSKKTLTVVSNDGYIKLVHAHSSNYNNYSPVSDTARTSTRFYNNSTVTITTNDATTRYLTSIVFTVTSSGYADILKGSWTNGTGVKTGSGSAQDPYIVTITPTSGATSVYRTLTNTTGVTACSVTWSDTSASASLNLSSDSETIAKGGTAIVTATYSNLTGSLTAGTSNNGVATVALSGESEGSKTVTITAVNVGKATITVQSVNDSLSKTVSVVVYGTSFKKVTMNSQISNGTRAIFVAYDEQETDYFAMSYNSGSSTNNRGKVDISVSNGVATNNDANIAMVTLNYISEGTHAGQYTLQDVNHGVYFYGSSSSNQLKTNANLDENDNAYYWTISLGASESIVTCVGGTSRYIKYNHNLNNNIPGFSTYASGMISVQMYVLSSDYPEPVNVESINIADFNIVEGSSGVSFTGSYSPANANESIGYTIRKNGVATDLLTAAGGVNMSNGTLTVLLTAGSVDADTEITLTLTAATNTISEAVTITIKDYSKTHDRITSAGNLYNGQKVIIATSTGEKAMGSSVGGTTVPSVVTPHSNDGADINGSSATEYTIWQIENSKWVFYADGYFLAATGTSSNNLERSLTLENNCKFTITISNNIASIVASSSSRGTMQYNSTQNYFSCYQEASQQSLSLYTPTAETSVSDARVAAGYERVFLKIGAIDVDDKGTNLCKTNNYYSIAKTVYGTLTASQINELSVAALNRLHDWAVANEEDFNTSTKAFGSRVNNELINGLSKENTTTTLVIALSVAGIITIGGYFFIRRRKQD